MSKKIYFILTAFLLVVLPIKAQVPTPTIKPSQFPTTTTLATTDIFFVNAAGITSKITLSSLMAIFQPFDSDLTTYAGITPSTIGQALLVTSSTTNARNSLGATLGIWPVLQGGTGTGTPGIVAGTNVSVTGTWPNQTVNSTATGNVSNPLTVDFSAAEFNIINANYVNFGTVSGITGYGFRDNSGSMEFKNLGGIWYGFQPRIQENTFSTLGSVATPLVWADGVGTMRETGSALNAGTEGTTGYARLPHANSFSAGTPIYYIDDVTTKSAGRMFTPYSGETLNGGTIGIIPFVAGAISGGSTMRIFETDGNLAWRLVDTNQSITAVRDVTYADRVGRFDLSNVARNTQVVLSISQDSTTVAPVTSSTGFVAGYDVLGNPVEAAHDDPPTPLSFVSGTATWTLSATKIEQRASMTLAASGANQLAMGNLPVGKYRRGTLYVTQVPSGTAQTIQLPSGSYTSGGDAAGVFTITPTFGAIDELTFKWDGANLFWTRAANYVRQQIPTPNFEWTLQVGSGTTVGLFSGAGSGGRTYSDIGSISGTIQSTFYEWLTSTTTFKSPNVGANGEIAMSLLNTGTPNSYIVPTVTSPIPTLPIGTTSKMTINAMVYDSAWSTATATSGRHLLTSTTYTAGAWVHSTGEGSWRISVTYDGIASLGYINFRLYGSTGSSFSEWTIPVPSASAWHSLGVIFDGGTVTGGALVVGSDSVTVYIDGAYTAATRTAPGGVSQQRTGTTANIIQNPIAVGHIGTAHTFAIDDIQIWNSNLSASQMGTIGAFATSIPK